MFDIFVKNSTITLNCFTKNIFIFNNYQITKSNKEYPNWWKSLPSVVEDNNIKCPIKRPTATIKRCDGLSEMFKSMISIPLWNEIIIDTPGDGTMSWISSAEDTVIEHHPNWQYNTPEFDNLIHLKIIVPWVIKEKTGTKFQLFHSDWNNPQDYFKYRIPGGVLNFKHQVSANCNMWLPNKKSRIELYPNMPLMNLLPITDKNVEIKNHIVDDKEYLKLQKEAGYGTVFVGRYKFLKQLMEK